MVSNPEGYPYSSYSNYISNKKDGLVHTDLTLGMMSQKRGVAIGENDGDPLNPDSILENVLQSILVRCIKRKLLCLFPVITVWQK